MSNNHLVLIGGKSATGKSASLMNLKNPEGVMYLNCENNKKLPFKSKFIEHTITNPMDVPAGIRHAETLPNVHTVVIDTLSFLMDMFESVIIGNAADTQKAWGEYFQFMKRMMSQDVGSSSKNIVFLSHTADIFNKKDLVMETMVKVKGSLMNVGIESFFSTVISTKKMPIVDLEKFDTPMLTITEDDKILGYKYVYQTKLTKETVNERIRSPMGMFAVNETFINNDVQLVIDRLHEYYGE